MPPSSRQYRPFYGSLRQIRNRYSGSMWASTPTGLERFLSCFMKIGLRDKRNPPAACAAGGFLIDACASDRNSGRREEIMKDLTWRSVRPEEGSILAQPPKLKPKGNEPPYCWPYWSPFWLPYWSYWPYGFWLSDWVLSVVCAGRASCFCSPTVSVTVTVWP